MMGRDLMGPGIDASRMDFSTPIADMADYTTIKKSDLAILAETTAFTNAFIIKQDAFIISLMKVINGLANAETVHPDQVKMFELMISDIQKEFDAIQEFGAEGVKRIQERTYATG
jgi:hypothetical protein